MSTLKEMAVEYRKSAAQVRVYMARLKEDPDADPKEIELCRKILRELRDTARLLSVYYNIPRTSQNAAVGWKARRSQNAAVGWKARRSRDDH